MDERDAVAETEHILRRMLPDWCDPSLAGAVSPLAFRPASNDRDGLSVYRSLFVTPEEVARTHRDKLCFVAELAVRDLLRLKLSVIPDPLEQGPRGHALVPELNTNTYECDKRVMKELTKRLADIAARGIVYRPDE